jgi:GNAT superfamily N-acetyltransferase
LQDDIRRIEELSLNAWPALRQWVHDGWILRFANGYTGRANSVQVLYDGTLGARRKIRFCEEAYARQGIPLLFKMTPAARPEGLDALLEGLGFRAFNYTSVQVRDLGTSDSAEVEIKDLILSDRVDNGWLATFARFRSLPARHVPTLRAMVEAITPPSCFAVLRESGEPVACGLGVIEGEWVGVFDVATREDRRRRGYATRLVRSITDWARRNGATRAYLQVMRDNQPAMRLYDKLAFREAYGYWYRAKKS